MRFYYIHVFIIISIILFRKFCVSQFHQDDYDIVHDKIEIIEVNKSMAPTVIIKVFKYNDTLKMKAINLTVDFKGLRKNLFITLSALKKVKNIYRPFPLPTITLDVCDEYKNIGERNPLGIKGAIESSNFKGCPVEPGIYYMDTWITEQDKFPPHLPAGDYKAVLHAEIENNIFVIDIAWYGSIVKKQKKKNKH